ncbi:hypothetical protein ACAW74_06495 [Fibrella sp. WM1]|uniref:hypothetical protein n=1 Tax=Fibrella musci TaxID=3242485 RepID=UPI00351FF873
MKTLLSIIGLTLLTISCKHDPATPENACTATDPLAISWVKDLTASLDQSYCISSLFQGTYKGQTVYFTRITDPACEYIIFSTTLLDCTGQRIKQYGSSLREQQAFSSEVVGAKTIYTSKRR